MLHKYNAKSNTKLHGKQRKSITFYIPEKALDRLITSDFQNFNTDYLLYLIHTVAELQHRYKDGYAYMSMKKLERLTDSRVRKYIKLLENEAILDPTSYKPGEKVKGYRINPELEGEPVKITIEGKSKLVEKVVAFYKNERQSVRYLPKHLKQMQKWFFDADFDYDGMLKYSNENYKGEKLVYALNAIERL